MDESQDGIKIPGRNISNLRYADDTTLITERKEELKSTLMRVKGQNEKADLKHNIIKKEKKLKVIASIPITSWQIEREIVKPVTDFIFLGFKITTDGDCSHEVKRCLLFGRKAVTNLNKFFKKQRHRFTNTGVYSQTYDFSSSHVWM